VHQRNSLFVALSYSRFACIKVATSSRHADDISRFWSEAPTPHEPRISVSSAYKGRWRPKSSMMVIKSAVYKTKSNGLRTNRDLSGYGASKYVGGCPTKTLGPSCTVQEPFDQAGSQNVKCFSHVTILVTVLKIHTKNFEASRLLGTADFK
jgi:hypothetical protein